jgi:hypothetical protein
MRTPWYVLQYTHVALKIVQPAAIIQRQDRICTAVGGDLVCFHGTQTVSLRLRKLTACVTKLRHCQRLDIRRVRNSFSNDPVLAESFCKFRNALKFSPAFSVVGAGSKQEKADRPLPC